MSKSSLGLNSALLENLGGGMVGQAGLEPATPRLSSACSNQLSYRPVIVIRTPTGFPTNGSGAIDGGGKETRTPDILLAQQALYQLSYAPACFREVRRVRLNCALHAFRQARG